MSDGKLGELLTCGPSVVSNSDLRDTPGSVGTQDLPVFRAALAHYDAAPRPAWDGEAPSAFAVHPSWAADADVPRALDDDPPTAPNFPDGASR